MMSVAPLLPRIVVLTRIFTGGTSVTTCVYVSFGKPVTSSLVS